MKSRRKQRIIIGTLCVVIIGMVVGYATLSQILNINGTSKIVGDFNIQFTRISENTMTGATTVNTNGIGTTTATFTVNLEKPGSSATYDVTVENKGTIDAVLKSIEGLDTSNNQEPLDIKFSIQGITEGDTLLSTEAKSFQVKVVWNSTSTSIPSTSKSLALKLNYEQKTSSSGGGSITTPESCFTINDQGVITGYTCEGKDVVIPNTINGITVTEIGSKAFYEKGLTSITIPDGVTTLGEMVFMRNSLTSFIIPDSVTTINEGALAYNKLTSIEIPNSVTSIGEGSFSNNQLTGVEIPNSVTTLGAYAFAQNQLTSVIIPNSITTLDGTFSDNKLTSVEIPDSVTTIGKLAFAGNLLTSITIPDSVTTIGSRAFEWNRLTTVKLGKGVKTISDAFEVGEPSSPINPITKIINPTGREFNWSVVTRIDSDNPTFVTGTIGQITITAE